MSGKWSVNIIAGVQQFFVKLVAAEKPRLPRRGLFLLLPVLTGAIVILTITGELGQGHADGEKPVLKEGVLDLSGWVPGQQGLINLNGEWEFYWQRLLAYEDFTSDQAQPDLLGEVPRVWNNYKLDGKNLPGFGHATYRLKVQNAQAGQQLAMRMPTVSTAYRLYIGAHLVASNGRVVPGQEHFAPEYQPVAVQFNIPSDDFDIILQVANYSYARGGLWYPIFLGSPADVASHDKLIGYKDLFLIGAFLVMALYYLCIYFMHKDNRSNLYFVSLCLIGIARTSVYGDYVINRILPGNAYQVTVTVDYFTVIWAPLALLFLVGEFFPDYITPKAKNLFVGYAVLTSLFVLLFPVHIFTGAVYFIQAVIAVMLAYTLLGAVRAYPKVRKDSSLVIAGALAMALGIVHDTLYHNNVIKPGFGELSSFGFLVFLFLQAIILARRFSQAFKEVRVLSDKLIELDELKDEYLANTTHELRTPLNAMINIAHGIARGTEGPVNENQQKSLAMIVSSGKSLSNLINDILDYELREPGLRIYCNNAW